MRLDKLTTKFQEALADAQSLRYPRQPLHRAGPPAAAMLAQPEGPRRCSPRRRQHRRAEGGGRGRDQVLPQVQGSDQVQPRRDLAALLQAAEKEASKRGDQFIASEMFLLALADSKPDRPASSGHG